MIPLTRAEWQIFQAVGQAGVRKIWMKKSTIIAVFLSTAAVTTATAELFIAGSTSHNADRSTDIQGRSEHFYDGQVIALQKVSLELALNRLTPIYERFRHPIHIG
jgi:hypothetical protein